MPASLALAADDASVVEDYLAAMRAAGRTTGRSTTQAARTCQAKIRRAGGWGGLTAEQQLDAVAKARVVHVLADGHRPHHRRCRTAQPHRSAAGTPGTPVLRRRPPLVHRNMFPDRHFQQGHRGAVEHRWRRSPRSPASPPRAVTDEHFDAARVAMTTAYARRGKPSAGREHGRGLPPPAADAVPRRPDLHAAPADGRNRRSRSPDGPRSPPDSPRPRNATSNRSR